MVVKKRRVSRAGKNINFRRGGGINIVFGPKYRPLGWRVKDSGLPGISYRHESKKRRLLGN